MITLVDSLLRSSDFDSADIELFEHQLITTHGARKFDLPDRQNAKLRSGFVQLHDVSLGSWAFGTAARIKFSSMDDAVLGLPAKGSGAVTSGSKTVTTSPSRPTMVSPGHSLELEYSADLEKLFVRVRRVSLENKIGTLIHRAVNRKIDFDLSDFVSQDMMSGLLGLIRMLVYQIDGRRSLISPLALRELEEALTVQLLFTGRHNFSELLHQPPLTVPNNVISIAEQYIEANWNYPITVEALVEITGVSGRTLFRSFEKDRGYSPMAFARKIRLEHAHQLLSEPDPATTVTGAALACGFSNLGRFAQEYWDVFGELPSRTLAARK